MADLDWDYAYIDLASEKTSHPWTLEMGSNKERHKHDASVGNDRRENSVNMNLEVEDPLYAKVQRRGSKNSGNRQMARAAANTSAAHLLALSYGAGANEAAAVIQRAYRAHRLQSQFSRLMSLAMSADRLDRRLSLLGPGKQTIFCCDV